MSATIVEFRADRVNWTRGGKAGAASRRQRQLLLGLLETAYFFMIVALLPMPGPTQDAPPASIAARWRRSRLGGCLGCPAGVRALAGSSPVSLMDAAILICDLEPFRQARPVWDRAADGEDR